MSNTAIPSAARALVHNPQTHDLTLLTPPVPTPTGPDEHLLAVHAVALTNGELSWPEPATVSPHAIPGYEVSGTVIAAPPDSPFQPSADVYARTAFDRPGSARPYSIALTAELGRKPQNLSWEAAATVPLSALTAWQALFDHGGLAAPGDESSLSRNRSKRILITAAAGGVGLWAVQLAKLAGVDHIVGTCGSTNAGFVLGLGADEVVDYTVVSDLASWVSDRGRFDLVLDCVGGSTLEQAWLCVKADNGMLISIVQPPEMRKPQVGISDNVRSLFFIVEANGRQLEKITSLIEQKKCTTVVDSAFAFEEFGEAFDKVRGGHLRGKVVLSVAP
ncbi:putative alcohol dehydrogenase zinc-binding domain-containing protein [Phaeoacremonium minimum UCRPA7]|uniref:Putative alcohol dehydrogenase zinc-binding domain-containing protein n=1 Tax=Phaeoacremonium minimum (strain UCR-PA7) TaxID=1286976 RepID=R8BUA9_PHAM7|nr:putative alcohol dehydrogenase zinc-binding domain-containing protein [Phaeoacremonium minimum UCRPA7]EOO02962.1 putative alcohol dehydrogenase zinc-binding domain-containing protein [Phaeoacremonium minimum UCRPA7]